MLEDHSPQSLELNTIPWAAGQREALISWVAVTRTPPWATLYGISLFHSVLPATLLDILFIMLIETRAYHPQTNERSYHAQRPTKPDLRGYSLVTKFEICPQHWDAPSYSTVFELIHNLRSLKGDFWEAKATGASTPRFAHDSSLVY